MARPRHARGALPDRRRRRAFDEDEGARRRPPALLRPRDLAASARPGDARRAIVPGNINPCEPPLSSRRLSACARMRASSVALPLLAAASAPAVLRSSPIEASCSARAPSSAAPSAKPLVRPGWRAEAHANEAESAARATGRSRAGDGCGGGADHGRRRCSSRLASRLCGGARQQLAREQAAGRITARGTCRDGTAPASARASPTTGRRDEFVNVRLLLDVDPAAIRSRTAQLSRRARARASVSSRPPREPGQSSAIAVRTLRTRRQQFAALEQRALQLADKSGGAALSAGDVGLVRRRGCRSAERLSRKQPLCARSLARSSLPNCPHRLVRPRLRQRAQRSPFAYALPAQAAGIEGLGAVDDERRSLAGLTLATCARRSDQRARSTAPSASLAPSATMTAILIIDHGGGWMSLLVNVRRS